MKTIVQKLLPTLTEQNYTDEFRKLNIDSIDLVSLRVEVENRLGKMIPNKEWLTFNNLQDILNYCNGEGFVTVNKPVAATSEPINVKRNFINMPQLCLEALSENWLFKEAGCLHWELLCEGLGTSSSELKDDVGNRLYATFVRIRIDGSGNLNDFKENNPFEFKSELSRFGLGMFFSNTNFESNDDKIAIEMMTSFSVRKSTGNNKSLAKSQPVVENCKIKQYSEFPNFGNEYRLIKKKELPTFYYKDYIFHVSEAQLFTYEYGLNPYYDLNGVGLLYFASYPIINDYCEWQFFNSQGQVKWEENYFTLFRDVMYYANCDARDIIIYVLNSVENLSESRVQLCSTLIRKSDGIIMARIFTIKQRKRS